MHIYLYESMYRRKSKMKFIKAFAKNKKKTCVNSTKKNTLLFHFTHEVNMITHNSQEVISEAL